MITQIQILSDEEEISNDPPPWIIGVIFNFCLEQILNREEGWKPSKFTRSWSKHMVKVCGTLQLFDPSHVIKLMKTTAHLQM